jgi:hypothetical protein
VLETGRTDVNASDARSRVTERILCGLPRSAPGDEDIQIGAIRFVGPKQVIFGPLANFIAPLVASAIEIFYGWGIRMGRVELAYRIGAQT